MCHCVQYFEILEPLSIYRVLYADPVRVKRYLNRMEREGIARVKVSILGRTFPGSVKVSILGGHCQGQGQYLGRALPGSRSVTWGVFPGPRSVSWHCQVQGRYPWEDIPRVKVSILGGHCQGQGQSPGRGVPGSGSVSWVCSVPGLLSNCSYCSSRCSW